MQETTVDIAIVGGGPAGLSAGVWAARYMHSVAIVDSGDPRNAETLRINGFLGLDPVTPSELRSRGRDACRKVGVQLIDAIVLRAERHADESFLLCLEGGGRVYSRRLLLAIGLR